MYPRQLNPRKARRPGPFTALFMVLFASPAIRGADPATPPEASSPPPPGVRTTQQDHQALKELLGITSLRPGR